MKRFGRLGILLATVGVGAAALAAAQVTQSVTYDALGRVSSVITADGKQTIYSYDPAGNRTTVAVSSTVEPPPTASDWSKSYTYGANPLTFDPRTLPTDTVDGVTPAQFGTTSFSGTSVTYTPPTTHVTAVDHFGYEVHNSSGLTASAMVAVTLINPAPVINPNPVSVVQGGSITYDPSANDTDPGGLGFRISAVTQPANGSVAQNGDKSVTYTPRASPSPGYFGPDSFTYTVTNTSQASATGTASVTVTALPPIANPFTTGTNANTPITFDPRSIDSDPNGLNLTITAVGPRSPLGGGAVINSGQSITYTPPANQGGTDSFSYTIANTGGGSASSTVSVAVQQPLSVALSSGTWSWWKKSDGTLLQVPKSGYVTATPSGGQAPYSYAWQYVSGQAGMTASAPTSNQTFWSWSPPQDCVKHTATWQIQVTDNQKTTKSATLAVSFEWDGTGC